MDRGHLDQACARFGVEVVIPRQAVARAQPAKRAFHPPARRQPSPPPDGVAPPSGRLAIEDTGGRLLVAARGLADAAAPGRVELLRQAGPAPMMDAVADSPLRGRSSGWACPAQPLCRRPSRTLTTSRRSVV